MKKKLIEVALPLEAINAASAREKSIRHGHPSTLHLWWARRPLAACRAVLFASLVDDPSSLPEEFPTEEAQEAERKRLFGIIEELVKWENSNNERVLEAARKEILKSTDGNPPPVLDPFCGGGSIPLEAQRLGLEAHGSDLNPVAVLITKALIEIPPKFAGQPPVNPESRKNLAHSRKWKGAQGLAEDVRYYGKWMRDEAEKRIGHLYPKAKLPDGSEATVIAWLWARTVKCPNPACSVDAPLIRSFSLSKKKGRRRYLSPATPAGSKNIRFEISERKPEGEDGTVGRQGGRCLACNSPLELSYVRSEGRAGRLGRQLTAIVAEGSGGREYLKAEAVDLARVQIPRVENVAEEPLPKKALGFRVQAYGFGSYADFFTDRQLLALTTFSELVNPVRERIATDFIEYSDDREVGAYADAVATYLGLLVDKLSDLCNTLNRWEPNAECPRQLFARQTISMVWDFAEGNPFSESSGSWSVLQGNLDRAMRGPLFDFHRPLPGSVKQQDATSFDSNRHLVSTDPPYYDNIGYADLSDFFYVWLRRSLQHIYPSLFGTLLVPKSEELVANPHRFDDDDDAARRFFEHGLEQVFVQARKGDDATGPMTVFYAFKQTEFDAESAARGSTGWETMLEGLLKAGFAINGTWPIRTEMTSRMRGQKSNALASSIVLSCRRKPNDLPIATRREFLQALKMQMAEALHTLQNGNLAPVDLQQSSIGPGMAIFSGYSKVVEADGTPMTVRVALRLISQAVDEVLAEQEGEFDSETTWSLAWYEDQGVAEGPYGRAEVLSTAKNVSVKGMEDAGVVTSGKGKVRLLKRSEMPPSWDPASDRRFTIWEATQHLIRRLQTEGEDSAADLLRRLGPDNGDRARDLAYRLYTISERKGWTDEALAYNSLVVAWPELTRRAAATREGTTQEQMF